MTDPASTLRALASAYEAKAVAVQARQEGHRRGVVHGPACMKAEYENAIRNTDAELVQIGGIIEALTAGAQALERAT